MFGRRGKPAEGDAGASKRDSASPNGSPGESPDKAPGPTDKPGGKGRPTPRRTEAEQRRRQRIKPPANRREAARLARADARVQREQRRKALLSGDSRALPRRDQGPVRAFVRDFIDSRRSVAEFFLIFAVAVLVASLLPITVLRVAAFYMWSLMLILIVVDSVFLGVRLSKALRERFPDENRKGAIAYAIMRSTQLRRFRLPPPRVKPGDAI